MSGDKEQRYLVEVIVSFKPTELDVTGCDGLFIKSVGFYYQEINFLCPNCNSLNETEWSDAEVFANGITFGCSHCKATLQLSFVTLDT